jgi:hypothetical protein
MGLDLGLREADDLAGRQGEAVQAEAVRIDAVLAPLRVLLAHVEELARRLAVAVEVEGERGLLGAGHRAGDVAGAVKQVVEPGGELRIVDDLWGDLGSYVTVCH